MDKMKISRALLSVSDKTGLVELGHALVAQGVEILSTGGTKAHLSAAGLPVVELASWTGWPEMMGGRVKTLHPRVYGGLLGRRDIDASEMAAHDIPPIDLLVVNLYPFETQAAAGGSAATILEAIDIGGVALIRAAAKNHAFTTVLTDPSQYAAFLSEFAASAGGTSPSFRARMAGKAFIRTACYDAAIAGWLTGKQDSPTPPVLILAGERERTLRYGENPQQKAAFYLLPSQQTQPRPGIATARQLQGKELSYNNLADLDAAFEIVAEFSCPAAAIVKHMNPSGVAEADHLAIAFQRALDCDPISAFGGIVALNQAVDEATAKLISRLFIEAVIAPTITPEAQAIFATRPNLRLLETGQLPSPMTSGLDLRSAGGGILVQTRDTSDPPGEALVVTQRAPTAEEMGDLCFAMRVARHVKSNAIVYARNHATLGIGAGQMSRVDSARLGIQKAEDAARHGGRDYSGMMIGSVAASDAFLPFPDSLVVAASAGVTALIQPGGSVRDTDVIAAANERGIAMVFTGRRHFRH